MLQFEYSLLALKSTVKSLSATKLLGMITMLRVMIVCMLIMIVFGLTLTHDIKLTFQIRYLVFQMQSSDTLYFNKSVFKSEGM